MYETLLMVKPGVVISLSDIEGVLNEVAASGKGIVERRPISVLYLINTNYLRIQINQDPNVIKESCEIAAETGVPCEACSMRFEMEGEDDNMELFNDYILINEKLDNTGNFFIFDQNEGRMFGT